MQIRQLRLAKELLEDAGAPTEEVLAWHGSNSPEGCRGILLEGLDPVRSGGHGAINKYGRGAYVSALHNFAYSAGSYCCDVEFVDGQTYKMIFLCSVLPGALCKTPQGKFIEKDSSVDCLQNPKIYALSRQNQCAVKYAVLFRDI